MVVVKPAGQMIEMLVVDVSQFVEAYFAVGAKMKIVEGVA